MREELTKFHKITDEKIFEVGSPQFDYYFYNDEIVTKSMVDTIAEFRGLASK